MLVAMSLFMRVLLANGAVLAIATLLLLFSPIEISYPVTNTQATILVTSFVISIALNILLLRGVIAPLRRLTATMRSVEPLQPGRRVAIRGADADVEALTTAFNDMLDRLEDERRESGRRVLLAQEAERQRIARELHDVVAHHVSVLGVQAGAARVVLDRDPAASRAALENIESGARSALEEMHRLLGVLRDPAPEQPAVIGPAPPPGLDAVEGLLDRARSAGLDVTYAEIGDRIPVPPGVALSAYRIVQEAVTNTLRHAAATRVDVRIRHLDAGLEVEVVDDGRAVPELSPPAGSRRGLGQTGMRERVALHGGELELGPRPDGGYRVRARFPLRQAVPT
jgi:signal transduction histidine kinase